MRLKTSGAQKNKKPAFISGPLFFVLLVMVFICVAVILTQYTLNKQTKDTANKWEQGWCAWKSGNVGRALELWPESNIAVSCSRNPAKFYYWRYRAFKRLGMKKEAEKSKEKLLRKHPFDYYSFLISRDGGIQFEDREQTIVSAKILFLRPWKNEVEEAARKTGVPEFCIWAVMRRESKFDAGAVSKSGAVGLMQLMPNTAGALAHSVGITSPDLMSPRDNILMGASHIKQLSRQFGGSFILTAAAYNAGTASVKKWGTLGAKNWTEWIENIPYAQTREFVRCVLSNREMYRILCGSRAPTLSEFAGAPLDIKRQGW